MLCIQTAGRLLIVGLFMVGTGAAGQSRPAPRSGYARYARAITDVADSAATSLNLVARIIERVSTDPDAPPGDHLATAMAIGGIRATRYAKAFEVVVPPPDLSRLHEQLLAPLQVLRSSLTRAAALLGVNCDEERKLGLGCDEVARKADGSRAGLTEFGRAEDAVRMYLDARVKAERMLAATGTTLPPLPSSTRR